MTHARIPRAAAVVLDGRRVLLIKRFVRHDAASVCSMCEHAGRTSGGCPGHHYAVVPGGHVEAGETAEAAAVRELAEETSLRATIGRLLWEGLHNGRHASYFLMADVVGVPVLSGPEAAEHSAANSFELRWAEPADFDTLRLHPPDLRAPLAALLATS